ncbi:hypothetical protein SAMN05421766_104284 [Zobellia uliginosa]|uniref:Uncharacterized protein n=1 Tax=Zobellia uliginosa TaxID=143224 RepID=A0ABY1KW56_9FLAO|nr:hypothetical protein [Zobellia uliginosa]SIS83858.1 hypothetical protein SAMN05421766_104284 [Zobellia uliginosa]
MVSLIGMAQDQLNDYKYIIVPKKFDGFKKENQYQTSTLVKFLFTEKGFQAVYEDELPSELNNNRCLGLVANLIDDSSMFTTKAGVVLENCKGQEVFTTAIGKSKEKDYKLAYGQALRNAFKSFDTVNYSYNGKADTSEPVRVSFKDDVKQVGEKAPYESKNRQPMVEQVATKETQSYKDNRPQPSNYKSVQSSQTVAAAPSVVINASKSDKGTLYAQEIPNGFQLVDSTPKIQLKIFKTSLPNYFLAEGDEENGVVFQQGGKWYFEQYVDGKLKTEELAIKF